MAEKTGSDQKNKLLSIKTVIENTWLEIQIADTGHGIPKDKTDKIFEPLFSIKIYGVGLWATYRQAAHGAT